MQRQWMNADRPSGALKIRFTGVFAALAMVAHLTSVQTPAFAADEERETPGRLTAQATTKTSTLADANGSATASSVFKVVPYLQLGNHPTYGKTDSLQVLWISKNADAKWQVEKRAGDTANWHRAGKISHRVIAKANDTNEFVFSSELKKLSTNKEFSYRISCDGKLVFESTGEARKPKSAPYTFNLFGDFGENTTGQKQIASLCFKNKPDFIVMPGDLVYPSGRYPEYLTNYFPVYNSDAASREGVPLIRHTLTIGVVGNHDVASDHHSGPV
jgi:hypothetical protein